MDQAYGKEAWTKIYRKWLYGHEGDYVFVRRGTDIEGAIAGYFGNTQVLYDANGEIVKLIRYRKDHTLTMWKRGVWLEGRWLINSGQDSSKVFHTFEIDGAPATWRHAFSAGKAPGDYWIAPETEEGLPIIPGGLNLEKRDNKLYLPDSDIEPGAYYALVSGEIPAPEYHGPVYDVSSEPIITRGKNADEALKGYFGNTFFFREATGLIVEVIYYNEDHTSHSWRDGKWCDGVHLLNNAQDNSMICQTRDDIFDIPAAWCHPFAPFKKEGDMWVSAETRNNGEPSYPFTAAGMPVVTVSGREVIIGTSMRPREIYQIERGRIPLEELQARYEE